MHYCPRCGHHVRHYGYTCGCGDVWDQDFFYAEFGFGMAMQQEIVREEIALAELEVAEEIAEDIFGGGW